MRLKLKKGSEGESEIINFNEEAEEDKRELLVTSMKLVHFLLCAGTFYIFWLLFRYHHKLLEKNVAFRYNYLILASYCFILYFFNRTYNSYLLGYNRVRDLVFSEFLSQFFTVIIIYISVSFAWNKWNNPSYFIIMLIIQGFENILWAYFGNKYFFKLYPPKKTILIYRNKIDKHRFGSINGKATERLYRITNELMYDGSFTELKDKLNGFDAVFVAGVNSRCRNGILKYCKENNIPGFFLPHVGDVIMKGALHIQSFDSPVLFVKRSRIKPEYKIIKRLIDILLSLFGIVILSPVMLITAAAIKLNDGGSVIYRQTRLTMGGKKFKICKFRTMRVDAEKDGIARLSTGANDSRVTTVGKVIRKCRLDELPQLFNILSGDMSIVGPRPERPEIAAQYYKTFSDFKLRLQVKAGLTGYAQVFGKYNTDPYEKLEFDLLYINNMSILTDLKLIFSTFSVLFNSESTEGVEGITAMDYAENAKKKRGHNEHKR